MFLIKTIWLKVSVFWLLFNDKLCLNVLILFRRNPMKFFFIIINIDVMYCPKDIFLMATSRVTIFQVATSQMCNFPIATSQRFGYALAGCNGGPSAAARMG